MFMIFLSVFHLIYGSLNFYVFYRLTKLLNFKRKKAFYITVLTATFSYTIASILGSIHYNVFTKIIYMFAATWVAVLFFLFCTLLIQQVINLFHKLPKKKSAIAILILVGIVSIYSLINASIITVKEVDVPIGADLKIAQISDVHIGTVHNSDFLNRIAKKINKENPDIVFMTGDIVDGSAPLRDNMFDELDYINAPIYYVNGNHETYEGLAEIEQLIKPTNVIILNDEMIDINGVQVIGVDFPERFNDNNKVESVLSTLTLNNSKPSILLFHTPNALETANKYNIDLVLSGHTHNGQFFPFNLIVKIFFPRIYGLYEYNNSYQYVNPGTGTWGPPMRLGSRNEITILNI